MSWDMTLLFLLRWDTHENKKNYWSVSNRHSHPCPGLKVLQSNDSERYLIAELQSWFFSDG